MRSLGIQEAIILMIDRYLSSTHSLDRFQELKIMCSAYCRMQTDCSVCIFNRSTYCNMYRLLYLENGKPNILSLIEMRGTLLSEIDSEIEGKTNV